MKKVIISIIAVLIILSITACENGNENCQTGCTCATCQPINDCEDCGHCEDCTDGNDSQVAQARDALRTALTEANGKQELEYTPETWGPFANARTAAQTAYDNPNATAGALNTARTNLSNAMGALQEREKEDPAIATARANLLGVLETARPRQETTYMPATWTPFANARTAAETAFATATTAGALDTARTNLSTTMGNLVARVNDAQVIAARTALHPILEEAEAREEENYESGWAPFVAARTAARTAYDNPASLVNNLDTARTNLSAAMDNLKELTKPIQPLPGIRIPTLTEGMTEQQLRTAITPAVWTAGWQAQQIQERFAEWEGQLRASGLGDNNVQVQFAQFVQMQQDNIEQTFGVPGNASSKATTALEVRMNAIVDRMIELFGSEIHGGGEDFGRLFAIFRRVADGASRQHTTLSNAMVTNINNDIAALTSLTLSPVPDNPTPQSLQALQQTLLSELEKRAPASAGPLYNDIVRQIKSLAQVVGIGLDARQINEGFHISVDGRPANWNPEQEHLANAKLRGINTGTGMTSVAMVDTVIGPVMIFSLTSVFLYDML
jgi:hypothetical protein